MTDCKIRLVIKRAEDSPTASVFVAEAVGVDANIFKLRSRGRGADPVYIGVCMPLDLLNLPVANEKVGGTYRGCRATIVEGDHLALEAAISNIKIAVDKLCKFTRNKNNITKEAESVWIGETT